MDSRLTRRGYWAQVTLTAVVVLLMTNRSTVLCSSMPFTVRQPHKTVHRIFYQTGHSELDLPECTAYTVCNRVDTYSTPWVERQCRCPGGYKCPATLNSTDGHTIIDKSRQFKLCEPVNKLKKCHFFKDITWTYTMHPNNTTYQTVNCTCPEHSVSYISRHEVFKTPEGTGYRYSFACSPQSSLRCRRKEPCRLFTVKKRPDVEEVNTNTLCQCPHGHVCPQHHTNHYVISGTIYPHDHIKTYSGYCSVHE